MLHDRARVGLAEAAALDEVVEELAALGQLQREGGAGWSGVCLINCVG